MKFLPCHVCGKDFSKTAYLNKHLKIHEEISVHNSNLCDKKFKTRQSLYQHKQSHDSRNNILAVIKKAATDFWLLNKD